MTAALIILGIGFVVLLAFTAIMIREDGQQLAQLREDLRAAKNGFNVLTIERNNLRDELIRQLEVNQQEPQRPASELHPSELVDVLIDKEQDARERAASALYRLRDQLIVALGTRADGTGPIFSASKAQVADRAIEMLSSTLDQQDWREVERWLDDHPGQIAKLGIEFP